MTNLEREEALRIAAAQWRKRQHLPRTHFDLHQVRALCAEAERLAQSPKVDRAALWDRVIARANASRTSGDAP